MTTPELVAVARAALPPVGATSAVAAHDGTGWRAMWSDGLRRLGPIGPGFERFRDAARLIDLINGPASRSAPRSDLAGLGAESRDGIAASTEAPEPGSSAPRAPAGGLVPHGATGTPAPNP